MQNPFSWIFLGVIIFIGVIGIFGSFTIVDPQERAIVVRAGSISRTLGEGFHIKFPFIESVTKIDLRTQAYPISELAYSKDAQTVAVEVTLNYRIDPTMVEQVFREVGKEYETRLIAPAIKEAIKSTISEYTAQGILDNRPKVPVAIKNSLVERLLPRGFVIDTASLTNLDFDDAYEEAVKNKQVQEQQALAQVNITKQEEQKKQQEILKAEALAEKTRLESEALASQQGQKLIEKIYAEAALEAAKKWNGALPTQMIPGGTLPFIQVGK